MQYLKKKRRYILKLGGGNEMISSLCKWNTITKSKKKKPPAMYNHKQVMPDCSGNPLNSVTLDKRDIF